MCGIAGFIGPPNFSLLSRMADLMKNRGPDGFGYYEDPAIGVNLCHARLAVLDHEGGVQPMWNEDHSICVVFNGEIYNHAKLRRELENKGHKFQSEHSDTEVLVHGYEEWGRDLLLKLNGMFAFCIYDKKKKNLFFGRDRFGKKPLYYSLYKNGICFSSDLRVLLLNTQVCTEISRLNVHKYFAYGFIPAPHTLYKDIYKLPGGCGMDYDLTSLQLSKFCYWQFRVEVSPEFRSRPESDLAEELLSLLTDATKVRMIADVPVGIFLSGGIDSSSILACAARSRIASDINSFSLGFSEEHFNEADDALKIAQYFGTKHSEKYFSIDMVGEVAENVLGQLDEPNGDSSILPTFLLAKFAREKVTVALSGEGGDELFAGYPPFKALKISEHYINYCPSTIRAYIRSMVGHIPASENYFSLGFKLKKVLDGVEQPIAAWNPAWLGPLSPKEISELMVERCDPAEVYADAISAWMQSNAEDNIGKTSEFYAKFYMQDGVLSKVDRASMMVSLEVRSPFLDNSVVDFARNLPSDLKLKNGISKYILKKSMKGILPDEVLYRKKRGFAIPLTKWLKSWDLPNTNYSFLSTDFFYKMLQEHQSGKKDNRLFLWNWMVLAKHYQNSKSD